MGGFQTIDTANAGGYGMGGMGWGAGGLGAFGGALVGGILGDTLFGRRGYGDGYGRDGGYGYGNLPGWELFKEQSDMRREAAVYPYISENTALQQTIAFNERLANMQAAAAECCCATQKGLLENRYLTEKEIAGLAAQQAACCCETQKNLLTMGYETQLRDQGQFGALMTKLAELECTVKTTETNEIIRDLTRANAEKDRTINTQEIIAAMKPVAPVPAYIQANPYENFLPKVQAVNPCGPAFNNCNGFQ